MNRFAFPLLFAVSLVGCPSTRTAPDAGDPRFDAAPVDAPCDCDDEVSCTIDSCDRTGRCVHWSGCPGNEACVVRDGVAGCESARCRTLGYCPALPCNERGMCAEADGPCWYTWNADRDNDGSIDQACGGPDCLPSNPRVPGVEECNGLDDDCNGEVDDIGGSDPLNCGRCGNVCTDIQRDVCVDGECMCNPGRTLCVISGDFEGCRDLRSDPEFCGSCETRCFGGDQCTDGVCGYLVRESYTLDAQAAGAPLFAPNGEILLLTLGRPTQLTHSDGRPDEVIPPGPSPYNLHAVRLDASGSFMSVTSIPPLEYSHTERGVPSIAVTNDGFYFAGIPRDFGEHFGVTFAVGSRLGMIGYVPRATGTVAWIRTELGLLGVLATRAGSALSAVDSMFGTRPRRWDSHGDRLPHDARLDSLYGTRGYSARSDDGFMVLVGGGPGNLGPGVPTSGSSSGTFALLFNEAGVAVEEVGLGVSEVSRVEDVLDDDSWVLNASGRFVHFTGERSDLLWESGDAYFRFGSAMLDGSGLALVIDHAYYLARYRDGIEVSRVNLPGLMTLTRGAVWFFGYRTETTSTLSRIDLPPLP